MYMYAINIRTLEIHLVYMYAINIRTLEIHLDMLCPLNKSKVIFKGSS